MKKLNGKNLKLLMLYLHNNIHGSVDWSFDSIKDGRLKEMISYPPDVELYDQELVELSRVLKDNPSLENTLKKIMINAAMYPLFDFFNFIDGTGDILDGEYEALELVECTFDEVENLEDREDFLHDLFFETYWDWKEKK